MRDKKKNYWIRFFALGSFLLMFRSALPSRQTTKLENGIPVVYNPKTVVSEKGVQSRIALKRDLVIGKAGGDENYVFSALRSVQVDNEENIFVLDRKDGKIKAFDKEGKHLRTFGKKGQGPGEFQVPTRMYMTRGGKLAIFDNGNKRIAEYSLTGECLNEISTAKWDFLQVRVDSRSHIYADSLIFSEKGVSEKLLKFDSKLNLSASIAEVHSDIALPRLNPMADRFVYDISNEDNLIWAFTTKYEIQVLNSEGKTIRKIIKDYDPIKITEKDKKEIINERYGKSGAPQGIILEFPAYYSPINTIVADDRGRIYVRTNEKDEKGNYLIDVFDSGGVGLTRFSLPNEDSLFVVKKDKLYCLLQENDEGIPQVKRYSMEWK